LLPQGPELRWTAIEYAINRGDIDFIGEILHFEEKHPGFKRRPLPPYLLNTYDTGEVSALTYGTELKKVNMSRGGRVGNNAFLEEPTIDENTVKAYLKNKYFLDRLFRMDAFNLEIAKKLISLGKDMEQVFYQNTSQLLASGHIEIVEFLLHDKVRDNEFQVNKLMFDVLRVGDVKDLSGYNKLSVMTVSRINELRPLHTAALNPNGLILKHLLSKLDK